MLRVYDIIAVPGMMPPTTPELITTPATADVELVQTPPGTALANVVVPPSHTDVVPVITPGVG